MDKITTANLGDWKGIKVEFDKRALALTDDQETIKTLLSWPIADQEAIKDVLYSIECHAYRMRMITSIWVMESDKFKPYVDPVSQGGEA